MRIAFISKQFEAVRGGSSLFGDIFSVIGERHDIVVFAREDRYQRKTWTTMIVSAWHPYSVPWLAEFAFARSVVRRILDEHARKPFDLIVVNQTIGTPIRSLKALGVPVVYVIHHPVSVDRELAITESASLFERIRWMFRYGPMVRIQRLLARTFQVVTVSQTAAERIVTDYAIPSDHIRVIVNGIDTDFFQKTLATERKTILAVGSYQHPRRGFRYLLEAYRALARQGFTVMDVGRRTEKQATPLRLIPGIQIFELITATQLRDLYSRASVSISTSLYEGFGLSLAESLSCGTPAVAFDSGGVRDVLGIVDERLLCPVGDVRTLVERVIEMDGRNDRKKLADRYHHAVLSHFSLSRMANEYEGFFLEMVRA